MQIFGRSVEKDSVHSWLYLLELFMLTVALSHKEVYRNDVGPIS